MRIEMTVRLGCEYHAMLVFRKQTTSELCELSSEESVDGEGKIWNLGNLRGLVS